MREWHRLPAVFGVYRLECRFNVAATAPSEPGFAPSAATHSSGVAGREDRGADARQEFGLVQLVVAADQNEHRLAVGDVNERLDLAVGRDIERRFGQRLDGDNAGGGEFFNGRADFARGGLG